MQEKEQEKNKGDSIVCVVSRCLTENSSLHSTTPRADGGG